MAGLPKTEILINPLQQEEDDREACGGVDVLDRDKVELKPPPLYKVIYLNDDFTSVAFVMATLVTFFNKTEQEAEILAQQVHEKGRGIAGIYTYDVATTKVVMVCEFAQRRGFPLKLITEAE